MTFSTYMEFACSDLQVSTWQRASPGPMFQDASSQALHPSPTSLIYEALQQLLLALHFSTPCHILAITAHAAECAPLYFSLNVSQDREPFQLAE